MEWIEVQLISNQNKTKISALVKSASRPILHPYKNLSHKEQLQEGYDTWKHKWIDIWWGKKKNLLSCIEKYSACDW